MHKVNYRLLQYPLLGIDYDKIVKNKTYFKSKYKLLLLNYYYSKSKDLEKTIKLIIKKSKFYKSIIEQLGLTDLVTSTFQCQIDELPHYFYGNKCLECGKLISKKSKFCSIKCSNIYKAKNEDFRKKLSVSVKKSHENLSKDEKQQRNKKIAESVKKYINSLDITQRREKFTNKNIRFTSYDNFGDNNSCTNILEIKEYIESILGSIVIENDKQLIKPLEIDLLIQDYKLGIEFNGILHHSFGKSTVKMFDNVKIDKNYHLNKTELAEQKGYQLLHIFENEWLDKTKQEI